MVVNSGLANSRDQSSAFQRRAEKSSKQESTNNSKGASKATFLQAVESTMTDPADNQTMWFELVKTHAHTWKKSMRTTGHRDSKTHAHKKNKNACAH